jgi:octaprenyl-diphosphate synthase
VQYTAEVISDLLEGEWIQDSLIHDFEVTLDQLDRVHNLKTSSLFKWCLRAPFIALNNQDTTLHQTLEEMGTLLGMLFQRSDDLLDFDIRNYEGKALLGDLKSGYLNSFGYYLTKDLSPELRKKALTAQSLGELKTTINEKYFDNKVQAFDELNIKLIERYHHLLKFFSEFLNEQERKLIPSLAKLPELLYWRKA